MKIAIGSRIIATMNRQMQATRNRTILSVMSENIAKCLEILLYLWKSKELLCFQQTPPEET